MTYKIIPYNGGGHALQRGGGRITELPSVYCRYYLRALQELTAESQKEYEAEKAQISAEETDVKSRLAALEIKREAFQNNIKKAQINAPYFTVQGHQNGILFSPAQDVGAGTLSPLVSQAFYAEGRLTGEIPDNEVEDEIF